MSTIDSGPDYDDLRPLNAAGEIEPGLYGCHRGATMDMNLYNPEPGKHYLWVNASHRGTQVRIEQWGYRRVPAESPVLRPPARSQDVQQAPLDTTHQRGDCILYEIDDDAYRRMRQYKETKAARQRGDVGKEYEESSTALSLQERYGGGSKPIYFRASGHGYRRG